MKMLKNLLLQRFMSEWVSNYYEFRATFILCEPTIYYCYLERSVNCVNFGRFSIINNKSKILLLLFSVCFSTNTKEIRFCAHAHMIMFYGCINSMIVRLCFFLSPFLSIVHLFGFSSISITEAKKLEIITITIISFFNHYTLYHGNRLSCFRLNSICNLFKPKQTSKLNIPVFCFLLFI